MQWITHSSKPTPSLEKSKELCTTKGSFTYYVIPKGEGGFRNDYANIIFALSNVEFVYGRGRGIETDKKWLRNM